MFSPIIDKNETILKIYAPNKGRAWLSAILMMILIGIFFIPITIGTMAESAYLGLGIMIGVYVVAIVLIIIFETLWLNKTKFAVTNKRILIRTGFIGVDYKSLDFTMLSALTVSVNILDKIKRNTGTISFGSMASPMVNNTASKFSFSFIRDPYKTYKEIKEIIDEHQSK